MVRALIGLVGSLAIAAATTASPGAAQSAAPAKSGAKAVPESINQFFESYFAAVEAGDPDGILAHIDSNFVIKWPIGHAITDRERLRSALASLQQRVRQEVQWEVLEAHVLGDWAWVRSTETPTHYPKAGGAPRTLAGWRLSILRKDGDKWLLHRDYGSLNEMPK